MKSAICSVGASILLWAAVCDAAAPRFASKDDFLAVYEPAARKLKEFYSRMYLSSTLTKSAWRKGVDQRPVMLEYRGNGDLLRSDRLTGEGAELRTRVRIATARQGYAVEKRPRADRFILDEAHADPRSTTESCRLFNPLPFAAYCFRDATIAELLKDPIMKLTSVEETKKDSELLLKVHFDWSFVRDGKEIRQSAWFLFSPNRSWACKGYSYGTTTPFRAEIEYAEDLNGFPLIKSAVYWQEENGKRRNVDSYEVRKLVLGPVSEDQFALQAFGITPPDERKGRAWLFAVLGVLLFIVVFFLTWLGRRRGARPA